MCNKSLGLFQGIFDWINSTRKSSKQTAKCTSILVTMILLYNTDGLILKNNAFIEKTQQNFVNFLHKYLKSYLSEKDAYSQLHKALMFVHDTKRIDELSQQRLQLDI